MLKVTHSVLRMDRAGQETFIMNLYRKIDPEKIRFDFLCTDAKPGDYDEEIRKLGGTIYVLPPITLRGPVKQLQKSWYQYRALRAHPCDVYHIHTHHAMDAFREALTAKLSGVKTVVVHSHNSSALFHLGAHRFFRYLLALLPIRRFACSKEAGQWMFLGNRYQVLHNGLDLNTFCFQPALREQVRQDMGWEDKKIVGHVGRFNAQKNHRFLLEVFAQLHRLDPQTLLILVGQGELEAEIRTLAAEMGLNDAVRFLGVRADVQALYQAMDLFLFPSLFEGLPVVLVEAQACDLPCLASDAISEDAFLTDRSVRLSLEESPEHWARQAQMMLEDAASRGDNSEQIRKAGYDITALAQTLDQYYAGVQTQK